MLDKSIDMCYVILFKEDTKNYPRYELPEGYIFETYKPGSENDWADVMTSVGLFDKIEDALKTFDRDFVKGHDVDLSKRMLFVKDPNGKTVATVTLWGGLFHGKDCLRLHWLATDYSCGGKGIAKAMVTKMLDMYNALGEEGFIYLITETWCYSAINIYQKFGFKPYHGDVPLPYFEMTNEEFIEQNERGWKLIEEKLALYGKNKRK